MNSRSQYDFKLVIVGDEAVGKSSLVSRFVNDMYKDREIFYGNCNIKYWAIDLGGKTVHLELTDLTGIKRMRPSIRSYYDYANGMIVAYDCTNLESFNNVKEWMKELNHYGPVNVQKFIVGTKCDLIARKVVDQKTAKGYADQLRIPFFETSAKNGTNVQQAFTAMATQMMNRVEPSFEFIRPAKKRKTGNRPIQGSNPSSSSHENNNNTITITSEDHPTDPADLWRKMKKALDESTAEIEKKFAKALDESTSKIEKKLAKAVKRIEKLENKKEIGAATELINLE